MLGFEPFTIINVLSLSVHQSPELGGGANVALGVGAPSGGLNFGLGASATPAVLVCFYRDFGLYILYRDFTYICIYSIK